MTTHRHCPGFEQYKDLRSFVCQCPECGAEKEIFSDEFDKKHTCSQCGKAIDFTRCSFYAGGQSDEPR